MSKSLTGKKMMKSRTDLVDKVCAILSGLHDEVCPKDADIMQKNKYISKYIGKLPKKDLPPKDLEQFHKQLKEVYEKQTGKKSQDSLSDLCKKLSKLVNNAVVSYNQDCQNVIKRELRRLELYRLGKMNLDKQLGKLNCDKDPNYKALVKYNKELNKFLQDALKSEPLKYNELTLIEKEDVSGLFSNLKDVNKHMEKFDKALAKINMTKAQFNKLGSEKELEKILNDKLLKSNFSDDLYAAISTVKKMYDIHGDDKKVMGGFESEFEYRKGPETVQDKMKDFDKDTDKKSKEKINTIRSIFKDKRVEITKLLDKFSVSFRSNTNKVDELHLKSMTKTLNDFRKFDYEKYANSFKESGKKIVVSNLQLSTKFDLLLEEMTKNIKRVVDKMSNPKCGKDVLECVSELHKAVKELNKSLSGAGTCTAQTGMGIYNMGKSGGNTMEKYKLSEIIDSFKVNNEASHLWSNLKFKKINPKFKTNQEEACKAVFTDRVDQINEDFEYFKEIAFGDTKRIDVLNKEKNLTEQQNKDEREYISVLTNLTSKIQTSTIQILRALQSINVIQSSNVDKLASLQDTKTLVSIFKDLLFLNNDELVATSVTDEERNFLNSAPLTTESRTAFLALEASDKGITVTGEYSRKNDIKLRELLWDDIHTQRYPKFTNFLSMYDAVVTYLKPKKGDVMSVGMIKSALKMYLIYRNFMFSFYPEISLFVNGRISFGSAQFVQYRLLAGALPEDSEENKKINKKLQEVCPRIRECREKSDDHFKYILSSLYSGTAITSNVISLLKNATDKHDGHYIVNPLEKTRRYIGADMSIKCDYVEIYDNCIEYLKFYKNLFFKKNKAGRQLGIIPPKDSHFFELIKEVFVNFGDNMTRSQFAMYISECNRIADKLCKDKPAKYSCAQWFLMSLSQCVNDHYGVVKAEIITQFINKYERKYKDDLDRSTLTSSTKESDVEIKKKKNREIVLEGENLNLYFSTVPSDHINSLGVKYDPKKTIEYIFEKFEDLKNDIESLLFSDSENIKSVHSTTNNAPILAKRYKYLCQALEELPADERYEAMYQYMRGESEMLKRSKIGRRSQTRIAKMINTRAFLNLSRVISDYQMGYSGIQYFTGSLFKDLKEYNKLQQKMGITTDMILDKDMDSLTKPNKVECETNAKMYECKLLNLLKQKFIPKYEGGKFSKKMYFRLRDVLEGLDFGSLGKKEKKTDQIELITKILDRITRDDPKTVAKVKEVQEEVIKSENGISDEEFDNLIKGLTQVEDKVNVILPKIFNDLVIGGKIEESKDLEDFLNKMSEKEKTSELTDKDKKELKDKITQYISEEQYEYMIMDSEEITPDLIVEEPTSGQGEKSGGAEINLDDLFALDNKNEFINMVDDYDKLSRQDRTNIQVYIPVCVFLCELICRHCECAGNMAEMKKKYQDKKRILLSIYREKEEKYGLLERYQGEKESDINFKYDLTRLCLDLTKFPTNGEVKYDEESLYAIREFLVNPEYYKSATKTLLSAFEVKSDEEKKIVELYIKLKCRFLGHNLPKLGGRLTKSYRGGSIEARNKLNGNNLKKHHRFGYYNVPLIDPSRLEAEIPVARTLVDSVMADSLLKSTPRKGVPRYYYDEFNFNGVAHLMECVSDYADSLKEMIKKSITDTRIDGFDDVNSLATANQTDLV